MHFAGGREAGEAAIGAGDDVLAPDDLGKPPDALGDRLGMLDEVRAVRDDAGDQLPSGSLDSSHTRHSCSCRGLPASKE